MSSLENIKKEAREFMRTYQADTPTELNERFVFSVNRALILEARAAGKRPSELKKELGGFYNIYKAVLLDR